MKTFPVEKLDAFYRIRFRAQSHGHVQYNLYVPESVIADGQVCFPIMGHRIQQVSGCRNYALVPDQTCNVFYLSESSGYRGTASMTVHDLQPVISDHRYHSGLGRLGETAFALVNAESGREVIVSCEITGRRVIQPKFSKRYTPSGDEIILAGCEDELRRILNSEQ